MASIVRCFVALAFLLVLFNVTMVDLPAIAVQSPSEHGQHQAIDEPESPADDMGLQLTPEDQSESPNGAQREDQNFIVTLQALETVVGGDEGESVDPKPVKDGTPDDGEPEEVEADVEAHESQMSVEDKGEEQEGNNDVGGWFPDKDTEEGEGGADGGDETDKADWERFKEQQQALSPRHGRDQSKFPFDRDEPADTGAAPPTPHHHHHRYSLPQSAIVSIPLPRLPPPLSKLLTSALFLVLPSHLLSTLPY